VRIIGTTAPSAVYPALGSDVHLVAKTGVGKRADFAARLFNDLTASPLQALKEGGLAAARIS
jgi:hypothetical protein